VDFISLGDAKFLGELLGRFYGLKKYIGGISIYLSLINTLL
jgi:hypothetical protein